MFFSGLFSFGASGTLFLLCVFYFTVVFTLFPRKGFGPCGEVFICLAIRQLSCEQIFLSMSCGIGAFVPRGSRSCWYPTPGIPRLELITHSCSGEGREVGMVCLVCLGARGLEGDLAALNSTHICYLYL